MSDTSHCNLNGTGITHMAHFHQRRRTRIWIPNPIVTFVLCTTFSTGLDSDSDPCTDSFPNGYCTHFRDGSPSQGFESESVSLGGNEPTEIEVTVSSTISSPGKVQQNGLVRHLLSSQCLLISHISCSVKVQHNI